MRLSDWLNRTGVKQTALAKAVGVTQGRISQLAQGGEEVPSIDLAAKIEAATDGAVTLEDFRPTVDVKPMISRTEASR